MKNKKALGLIGWILLILILIILGFIAYIWYTKGSLPIIGEGSIPTPPPLPG
jgi:hypothetical protein